MAQVSRRNPYLVVVPTNRSFDRTTRTRVNLFAPGSKRHYFDDWARPEFWYAGVMKTRFSRKVSVGSVFCPFAAVVGRTGSVASGSPEWTSQHECPCFKLQDLSAPLYFGMGSTIVAFSFSETSPSLPSIRYLIFSCFTIP